PTVSDLLLQAEGHLPGVPVPRGGAQDHLLLRGGATPDGGECPHSAPAPSPVRHQLSVRGDLCVHPGVQCGVRHLAHHQCLAADTGTSDSAA
ncbi:hypothetical protein NOIMNB_NOIMNB_06900, partial [Dysosmobacter welbionis]